MSEGTKKGTRRWNSAFVAGSSLRERYDLPTAEVLTGTCAGGVHQYEPNTDLTAMVCNDCGKEAPKRAGPSLLQQRDALAAVARHFREWHADHFENYDNSTNAELLCLDNEARATLARMDGKEGV